MSISIVENIDCIEFMKQYPNKFFELAIVDPPYGSDNIIGGYTSGKGGGVAKQKQYHQALWTQGKPTENYFAELFRVSQNQIIWGANHFISLMPKDSSCWIVWDKLNGVGSSFADCELAWGSFDKAVRKFVYRWAGMLQGDMKNKEERVHPTQKPVALYKWLLQNYAKPGDKILDTHLGSGSSRIAAHLMGFDFYSCEIDKDYFEAQEKRFKEQTAQQTLFGYDKKETA